MGTVDPTYPLYPVASVLASAMLLLVLLTNFVRQKWNLGVWFLTFWLFFENATNAINAFVWSDNADIKLYVYCDIVTHIQIITYIVKPMATLIITRRLYLIATLQAVELSSKSKRHWDLAIEWTLGLSISLLVAGPIYYVNQGTRFSVFEGFGCCADNAISILEILILESWTIIPPLVSVTFYYPKVAILYYRQRQAVNSFLRSNPSVSHTNYLRILALASIDILLTLPFAIVSIALTIAQALESSSSFSFYPGWTFLHTDWEPVAIRYVEVSSDTAYLAQLYFNNWTSPILAFAIFGLFGLTSEACTSYWRVICTVGGWFGWKPSVRVRDGPPSLGEIEFGARTQDSGMSGSDLEVGSLAPNSMCGDAPISNRVVQFASVEEASLRREADLKSAGEARGVHGPVDDARVQYRTEDHLPVMKNVSSVMQLCSYPCAQKHITGGESKDLSTI
ncbi:unnamed protein product [Peniophora sp. CBMAI 1063]|nr:unnamed protein product [Peniophora sp. CBMAI 1063]